MIYQELYLTQINKENVKLEFKRLLKVTGGSAPLIDALFNKAIDPFQEKISQLPHLEPSQLEPEFIGLRRGISELKYYISYLFQAEKELSLTSPKIVLDELLAQCDAYLHEIAPYLSTVIEWRKQNLPQQFEMQMRSALLKLGTLLKEKNGDINFLDEHAQAIQSSIDYLQKNFDSLERIVLEQGRSILIQEGAESPFKLLYSYSGGLYIIMEIAEHLIGSGGGKLCSRAILLQTGEIVAFVRPRLLFSKEVEEERKLHFERALKESDLLIQLGSLRGIVRLKERFFFEIDNIKRVYLIEELYPDGDLSSLLFERIKRGNPLTLQEKCLIAKEILTGISNLHAHHTAHADLKPDNVLINLTASPLKAALCDFNSAFDIRRHHNLPSLQINHPPEYISLFHREITDTKEWEKINPRPVDIWEAGTILYSLFFELPLPWAHFDQITDRDQIIGEIGKLEGDWIGAEWKSHPFYPLIQRMLSVIPSRRPTASEALVLFQNFE